jgi:hypothetical protein
LRLPVDSTWNTNASLESEARSHESGHAVAAYLTGRFDVVSISMDAKWGDYGERGHVEIRSRPFEPVVGTTREQLDAFDRQVEEQAFARGVVAAAGGFVAGDWDLGSSRADRELLQAVRPAGWTPLTWEYMVSRRTQQLVRDEAFRVLHRRLISKLEEVGDTGVLSGDELRQVLVVDGEPGSPYRIRALRLR